MLNTETILSASFCLLAELSDSRGRWPGLWVPSGSWKPPLLTGEPHEQHETAVGIRGLGCAENWPWPPPTSQHCWKRRLRAVCGVSLNREEIKDSSRDGKDMHLLSCHFIPGERSDTRRPSFKTPGPASGTSDSDLHLFHKCQRQGTMPKSLWKPLRTCRRCHLYFGGKGRVRRFPAD